MSLTHPLPDWLAPPQAPGGSPFVPRSRGSRSGVGEKRLTSPTAGRRLACAAAAPRAKRRPFSGARPPSGPVFLPPRRKFGTISAFFRARRKQIRAGPLDTLSSLGVHFFRGHPGVGACAGSTV